MTANLRTALVQALRELGNFYPEMRLGQLLVFVSSLTGEETSPEVEEAEDAAVLEAAREHMRHRASQLGVEPGGNAVAAIPLRDELLRALELTGDCYPQLPFGQLVAKVAEAAKVNVYDVEDEQLLEAARGQWGSGSAFAHAPQQMRHS
jgi:hypothetical protein